VQAAAAAGFPGEKFDLLCYNLYSDASATKLGGYSFHPAILSLTLPLQKMRALPNVLVIAYLPVVGSDSGFSAGR
jgi:hypothetical protein